MLTRRPPFQADTSLETLEQVRSREPVAPRQLRPGLPHDLETICLKYLQKDPARRYASAEALRLDLQRFLDAQPIRARPVSAAERAVRAARRRPVVAALAAALVLVSLAGVAGVFWKYLDAEMQKRLAQDAAAEATAKATLAQEQERRAAAQLRQTEIARYSLQLALAGSEWQATRPSQARRLLAESDPELRGWEYGHRRLAFRGSERVYEVTQTARAVATDPAGNWLASGGDDDLVYLWDARTGRPGPVLKGHEGPVHCVALSPEGNLVASGSRDRTVRVCETRTGKLVHVCREHTDSVEGVAFRPDGKALASCSLDRTVRVRDTGTWKETHIVRGQTAIPRALAYHPRGHTLAISRSGGQPLLLWEPEADRTRPLEVANVNGRQDVAFRSDGRLVGLSSVGRTYQSQTWDAERAKPLGVSPLPGRGVCLALSPGDNLLAVGLDDGTIRIEEMATGRAVQRLRGHDSPIRSVVFLRDGRLASASGWTVRVWNLGTTPEVVLHRTTTPATQTLFTPDGKRLVCAISNAVVVLDAATNQELRRLRFGRRWFHRLALHPNGRRIAITGRDEVKLWDLETGRSVRDFPVDESTSDIAMSPDGRLVAVAAGRRVLLFEVDTGKELRPLEGHTSYVTAVAFSADGRRIATASVDQTIRLWGAVSGALERTLTGHEKRICSVRFRGNDLLASASVDNTIKLWDVAEGKELHSRNEHRDGEVGVRLAFSPDGWRLVNSHDYVVRLWDVATAQNVLTLPPTREKITSVAFSPDGKGLVTTDGVNIRVWLSR